MVETRAREIRLRVVQMENMQTAENVVNAATGMTEMTEASETIEMTEVIVRQDRGRRIAAAEMQDRITIERTAEDLRMTADLREEIRAAVWRQHRQRR